MLKNAYTMLNQEDMLRHETSTQAFGEKREAVLKNLRQVIEADIKKPLHQRLPPVDRQQNEIINKISAGGKALFLNTGKFNRQPERTKSKVMNEIGSGLPLINKNSTGQML